MLAKISMALFTLALVIFVPACMAPEGLPGASTDDGVADIDTLYVIGQRGYVNVGYLVWSPLMEEDEATGDLSGIYTTLINQVTNDLNITVQWHKITLANFEDALNSGQIDVCAGPQFITPQRAARVAFTQPLAYVGNSAVVPADSDFRPTTLADLDQPGLRIAVLENQAMQEYVQLYLPNAELLIVSDDNLDGALEAVNEGRADIGFMDSVTVTQYAAEHDTVVAVLTGAEQLETLPIAWAVRHADEKLLRFLDSSITTMKATGLIERLQADYDIQLLYDTPTLHTAGE